MSNLFKQRGDVTITLLGDRELKELFSAIPRSLTKSIFVRAGKLSAKPFERAAKAIIRPVSRSIAKSIGTVPSKKHPGSVYTGRRVGKFGGWMAHWYEYGTSGKKTGKKRSPLGGTRSFAWVGGLMGGEKYRKATPRKPFIRPAWDQTKGQVAKSYTENIMKVIIKTIARKKRLKVKFT